VVNPPRLGRHPAPIEVTTDADALIRRLALELRRFPPPSRGPGIAWEHRRERVSISVSLSDFGRALEVRPPRCVSHGVDRPASPDRSRARSPRACLRRQRSAQAGPRGSPAFLSISSKTLRTDTFRQSAARSPGWGAPRRRAGRGSITGRLPDAVSEERCVEKKARTATSSVDLPVVIRRRLLRVRHTRIDGKAARTVVCANSRGFDVTEEWRSTGSETI
jgi:hypothetical protein